MSDDAPVWNIMTRTRGGTVSLLKNLTEGQARNVMQRLRGPFDSGDPWDIQARLREERQQRAGGGGGAGCYFISDADLAQIDCWGPPGETLEVWPKPPDFDEKWAAALAELDREMALEAPAPTGYENASRTKPGKTASKTAEPVKSKWRWNRLGKRVLSSVGRAADS